jgi:hypothetical protein
VHPIASNNDVEAGIGELGVQPIQNANFVSNQKQLFAIATPVPHDGGVGTAGLTSYGRGTMQVLDRPGLEKASCECPGLAMPRT